MNKTNSLTAGLDNLLFNCIGASAGETLAIISEQDRDDYYSQSLADYVADHARRNGVQVKTAHAPFLEEAVRLPAHIETLMNEAEHTLFLARLGDQVRFSASNREGAATMCYALDEKAFASPFCSADYRFFVALKDIINERVWAAEEITVVCPAGTYLKGAPPKTGNADEDDDVTVKRFPMSVFRPVPANSFSGRIALTKWLCGTGSRFYEPYSLFIDGAVYAHVEQGVITDFEGDRKEVEKIKQHYKYVADKYGIAGNIVHSWHAGFHPVNEFAGRAAEDLMRWSGTVFGNPRYLHFHTCGDFPPGEICISVFDPTISVDGVDLWRKGELVFAQSPEVRALMEKYPGTRELFSNPTRNIGLDEA